MYEIAFQQQILHLVDVGDHIEPNEVLDWLEYCLPILFARRQSTPAGLSVYPLRTESQDVYLFYIQFRQLQHAYQRVLVDSNEVSTSERFSTVLLNELRCLAQQRRTLWKLKYLIVDHTAVRYVQFVFRILEHGVGKMVNQVLVTSSECLMKMLQIEVQVESIDVSVCG